MEQDNPTPAASSLSAKKLPALASLAASKLAKIHLHAARAQRESADALEKAAHALTESIARAQAHIDDLEAAKAEALGEAQLLREKASELSVAGILAAANQSESGQGSSPVAAMFFQVDLASTRRHAGKARESWKEGDSFDLVAQPDNPVDPNAIMVMSGGVQVGFVSKESATELERMRKSEGWSMTGQAFMRSRKGGQWNEGSLQARLENPIMGWRGYNPSKSLSDNLSSMESLILGSIAKAPKASSAKKNTL